MFVFKPLWMHETSECVFMCVSIWAAIAHWGVGLGSVWGSFNNTSTDLLLLQSGRVSRESDISQKVSTSAEFRSVKYRHISWEITQTAVTKLVFKVIPYSYIIICQWNIETMICLLTGHVMMLQVGALLINLRWRYLKSRSLCACWS